MKLLKTARIVTALCAISLIGQVSTGTVTAAESKNYYYEVKSLILNSNYNDFYDVNGDGVINVFDALRIQKENLKEENDMSITIKPGSIGVNDDGTIKDIDLITGNSKEYIEQSVDKWMDENIDDIKNDLKSDVNEVKREMSIQEARMDQLVGTVPPGSADEVADARVMIDGKAADNLGDAIREQSSRLKEQINAVSRHIVTGNQKYNKEDATEDGYYDYNHGVYHGDVNNYKTAWIQVTPGTTYTVNGSDAHIPFFTGYKNGYISGVLQPSSTAPYTFTVPDGATYMALGIAASRMETFMMNLGEEALPYEPYREYIDLQYIDSYTKQEVDAKIQSIDSIDNHITTGNQKYNKEDATEDGYYDYNHGVYHGDGNNYKTAWIPVTPGTTYTVKGGTAHIPFFRGYQNGYISGVVQSSSTTPYTFTVPDGATYMALGIAASRMETFMMNLGEEALPYEPYREYIDLQYIDSYTKEEVDAKIPSALDYSRFTLPYIKNGKLCCNKTKDTGTAYYAGVDCGDTIDAIYANFVFEPKEGNGNATLIINPNGIDKVTNITDLSLHLQVFPDRLKLDVLGGKFGDDKYYYQTLIDEYFASPLIKDGVTEHTVVMSVAASSNNVHVTIDGIQYSGHFTPGTEIKSISEVIGKYGQIEHFCTGNRDSMSMPQFTFFQCRTVNGDYAVRDYFNREDGQLSTAPTGNIYHLINNDDYRR